ncbi:MAG: thymidine kinase [Holosporales bacterium]|jgi:thymidine kinase|nr:thymidine kinase [Holosporales bacterium]
MAKLYFYYSAMNAGKTTKLLQSSFNYRERGMGTILYTYKFDNRFGNPKISSRIGLSDEAFLYDKDFNIYSDVLNRKGEKTACVLVDEAQFLTKSQVSQLCKIVDDMDIAVLTYGLRTDFLGEAFEGSLYLLLWADELIEVKTICHCGKKAIMNARFDAGRNFQKSGEQIDIGGNEKYVSLCRKHYNERNVGEQA